MNSLESIILPKAFLILNIKEQNGEIWNRNGKIIHQIQRSHKNRVEKIKLSEIYTGESYGSMKN
jgi:hypothetical protein